MTPLELYDAVVANQQRRPGVSEPKPVEYVCHVCGHPVAVPSIMTGRAWCSACDEYTYADPRPPEAQS